MSDMLVEIDRFAVTLEGILGQVESRLEPQIEDAVNEAAKDTRKLVSRGARANFKTLNNKYKTGWRAKTKKYGKLTEGVVYHSISPGLPHLLEKGHAKVGGGFVAGREHIAPAADQALPAFEKRMGEAVESALMSL